MPERAATPAPAREAAPVDVARVLREGADLWNRGEFFACHDKLEEAWRAVKHEKKAEPAKDPRRDFLHGLILYAAAYVHWQRGNPLGVQRKLEQAQKLLEPYPPRFEGVDLAAFRVAVEAHLQLGTQGTPLEKESVPPLAIAPPNHRARARR